MAYTNKKSAKRKHRQKRRTKKVGGVITYTVHTRARSASNKATKEEKAAEKAAQQAEKAAQQAEKAAQKAEKAAQKAEKTRLVTVKVADEVSVAAVNQAFSSMFGEPYKASNPKTKK
jgi:type II secretory pathway pseudopilin PulG